MLQIVNTALQFAAGYIAADSVIKLYKSKKRYRCGCVGHEHGVLRPLNYDPLFNG